MFSKFFQLSFFAIFLMTHTLHASSSSSSASQDDDGVEIPKIATTTPLPNRDELLKQFQRLSGYPEPGYYALSYEGAAKVPGGIWGIFPWNWSYDLRVLQPLEALLELYNNDQLIALMGRKDFHGCLKLAAEYGTLQDFWVKYVVFNRDLKKNQRSNKLSWKHFLVTPAVLKAAQDAHELNLGGADLKVLPALPNLYLLQSLNLSRNCLDALPPSLAQMTNLGHLDLSSNQFAAVPDEVQHLTNLKFLDVEHNLIAQSPPWIGKLKKLETLDLSHNRLKGVGSSHELPALIHLYLSNNLIESLDAGFFTPTLLAVDLSGNKLESLPETLESATNLLALDASDNHLKTLPKTLGSLKKLGTLKAAKNSLTVVIPELGGLVALETLDLSHNAISALPNMGGLGRLKTCTLSHNKLGVLPEGLNKLKKLKVLNVSHNDLKSLSVDDLADSLVTAYFHENPIALAPLTLLGRESLKKVTVPSKALSNITNHGHHELVLNPSKDDLSVRVTHYYSDVPALNSDDEVSEGEE